MAFKTIREVVEWVHSIRWPPSAKAYRFAITTNGMLLNKERRAWFAKYRDVVTLCLSLDGTREAHNRNRNNSYDKVIKNIAFFKETWPHQPAKMTISQYTIDQMYDGIVNIHNLGLPVEANVVFEDVWGSPAQRFDALQTYASELDKLVHFYHDNPKLRRPRLIDKNIMALYDGRHVGDDMFCGAGVQMNCWTADASQYPCMRFAPISTSNPLKNLEQSLDTINTKCRDCPFERLCPTCEGHNYEVSGSCHNRTSFHCDFFKVEMMAAAKLFFMENSEEMLAKDVVGATEEENLIRLRKLLVVKSIMDYCEHVLETPLGAQVPADSRDFRMQ